MEKTKRGLRYFLLFSIAAALAFLLSAACSTNPAPKIETSPDLDFEKFKLILTDEEIDIYKGLPEEDRKGFLEECWKIRDPDPSTEENEARIEFNRRVEYANRWFGPMPGDRLTEKPSSSRRDAGWYTDRGKIYIILGPPDRMFFLEDNDFRMLEHDSFNQRWKYDTAEEELWDYDRHNMAVHFYKSMGQWILDVTPELRIPIEEAKLNYLSTTDIPVKRALKFEAEYKNGQLMLKIPARRINFISEEEGLKVVFRISIRGFRGTERQAEKTVTREIKLTEEEVLKKKELVLEIPLEELVPSSGFLDIVLEDVTSGEVFDRYRRLVKVKAD